MSKNNVRDKYDEDSRYKLKQLTRGKKEENNGKLKTEVNQESKKEKRSAPTELDDSRKRLKQLTVGKKEENDVKPKIEVNQEAIKEMLANAQRKLQAQKASMGLGLTANNANTIAITDEKKINIQALQARIQTHATLPPAIPAKPGSIEKPAPLILDSTGRTVDTTGKVVQLTHVQPTLKANLRVQQKRGDVQNFNKKSAKETPENQFLDPRIQIKAPVRTKRAFKLNEPGKFLDLANKERSKVKLEILKDEISQIARKTGIYSAAKLAQSAPQGEDEIETVPDIEWWDAVILKDPTYQNIDEKNFTDFIRENTITHLVEHPTQLKPPFEPSKPVPLPFFLTKREEKKLRRQNRREAWKDEQEKIRLGLIAAPEPKLNTSNLMRVLGTEAVVQDPTKKEAYARAQIAKRLKAHEDANAARKLTKEQKREKMIRKTKEDTSLGVHVTVYRVSDLRDQSKKHKVEKNAQQLLMTGIVVMFQDCNVIVVEGGPKQQRKYKKLMMHRIKWEENMIKNRDGEEIPNECVLIWEGMVTRRNFGPVGQIQFKACITEKLAREQFRKHGVEQYWDLAYSQTVLDLNEEKK